MRLTSGILFLLAFCSVTAFAQPRYSPAVRAEREAQWMSDSLHITPDQSKKVEVVSLSYNQEMDKTVELKGKKKDKARERIMNKKDAGMKAILTKQQYKIYYSREKQGRKAQKPEPKGPHQPL